MPEHEKKQDDLEKFLERETKRDLAKKSQPDDAEEGNEIVWDAAQAAVEYGKAQTMTEAAEAVIDSNAFSHVGEDASAVVVVGGAPKKTKPRPPEPAEGMVSDFQADSMMAGADMEPPEPDDYLFSAIHPESVEVGRKEEDEVFFGGGGGGGDDDDPKKRRNVKDEEPKPKDKKAEKKAAKAAKKAAKAAKKGGGSKPKK